MLAILDERPEISVEGFSGLTVKLQVKQKGHKADAWLREAKKDAASCDKPRGGANIL